MEKRLGGKVEVEKVHADMDAWVLRSASPSVSVVEELGKRGFETLRAYRFSTQPDLFADPRP